MADEAKKKADAPPAGQGEKAAEKKDGGKSGGGHASAPAGGLLGKTPFLLGGVMVLEAVVLFAGFKFMGGSPRQSAGAEIAADDSTSSSSSEQSSAGEHGAASEKSTSGGSASTKIDKRKSVEVEVLGSDFRATNNQSGRRFLYDVTIFAVTKAENKDRVENTIKERKALITDRVRTIIAECDPEKLGGGSQEPGLETLRRQVKYQLDLIIGEGVIDEVLVPRCIPFRADY